MLYDFSLNFMHFFNKKDTEPCILKNAELLNSFDLTVVIRTLQKR